MEDIFPEGSDCHSPRPLAWLEPFPKLFLCKSCWLITFLSFFHSFVSCMDGSVFLMETCSYAVVHACSVVDDLWDERMNLHWKTKHVFGKCLGKRIVNWEFLIYGLNIIVLYAYWCPCLCNRKQSGTERPTEETIKQGHNANPTKRHML